MEESTKKLWLTKVKKGIIAVVESPYAPNNHNCIWLKQDTMYVYGNRGWEELSSSGGDTPEPEPVDPKYIVLPVEFNSFEQKTITIDNYPTTVVISTAISVQKEATEYPKGIATTAHIEGTDDFTFSSTPTLITEDSFNPAEQAFFNAVQNALLEIYPNDIVELISITDYMKDGALLLIADINGERKTLCFIYSGGPLANVSNVTVEQGEEEPSNNIIDIIEGPDIEMIPFVIAKEEYIDDDVQKTQALIGYYADNIDGQIITRIYNGSYKDEFYAPAFHIDNSTYADYYGLYPLTVSTLQKMLGFEIFEDTMVSEVLPPITQQCIVGFFSNTGDTDNVDGNIITTKSAVNPEKTLIIIPCFGYDWQEIQGVGHTDTQIIANVFNMTEEEASEYTEHLRWIQHHHSA